MNEHEKAERREHQRVRIHIDQAPYESPNPTTGEALYALGRIPVGRELYREVRGNREDVSIQNDNETVHLTEDEHFHSGEPHKKQFTIIVNGRPKKWEAERISFDEVVALAFETPPTGQNILFTVTYRKADEHKPEGTLVAGESVKVKDRMIFNVTATDKS